jgi:hypothetical protein
MGTWIGQGLIPWWDFNSSNTFCQIGSEDAYDHAWPMCEHWTGFAWDVRDYNQGCWSAMYTLQCGQASTSVYSSSNGYQINYVETVDAGPCLGNDPNYHCGPPFWCSSGFLGDLSTAGYQALGHNTADGPFYGYYWQP